MATAPYLVTEGDELQLDVSVGQAGRQQFALSDRARALLVDDLEYGNRDVVPWVTTRSLVLAGGAYLRAEKTHSLELAWKITGADGGARANEDELECVAEYLGSVETDERAVETLREHVRETRLSGFLDPEDVRSKGERMTGLRDIAKDL